LESERSASGIVIQPQMIPFWSYPYEWCFSQMKDAALLTLQVQQIALKHGMTLKDASSYNVQFLKGKPIFIDTLSFSRYTPGQPWSAYQQFCQHFVAPLALMRQVELKLSGLLRLDVQGVPLQTASKMLPIKSWVDPAILTHIHMHACFQRKCDP